jgi:hypothetical protein
VRDRQRSRQAVEQRDRFVDRVTATGALLLRQELLEGAPLQPLEHQEGDPDSRAWVRERVGVEATHDAGATRREVVQVLSFCAELREQLLARRSLESLGEDQAFERDGPLENEMPRPIHHTRSAPPGNGEDAELSRNRAAYEVERIVHACSMVRDRAVSTGAAASRRSLVLAVPGARPVFEGDERTTARVGHMNESDGSVTRASAGELERCSARWREGYADGASLAGNAPFDVAGRTTASSEQAFRGNQSARMSANVS